MAVEPGPFTQANAAVEPGPATQANAADEPGPSTWTNELIHPAHPPSQPEPPEAAEATDTNTFQNLLPIPHYQRPVPKYTREKPPSLERTSAATIAFVKRKAEAARPSKRKATAFSKKQKVPKKAPKKALKTSSKEATDPCGLCNYTYGERDDPLRSDIWVSCIECKQWFHETCSFASGNTGSSFTCTACQNKAKHGAK